MSETSSEIKSPSVLKGHIPALDGLRGLAVALVFALHYHPDTQLGPGVLRAVDRAADLGWAGVSLFFALSGFLITGILWDSLGRARWWRNFYIRRSLRIFPLYYLVLTVVTVIVLATGYSWAIAAKISIDFLYLTDIPWLWREMFGFPLQQAIVHFWSLAVEEQFYLIWPFLLLAFAKNRKGLIRVCGVVWLISFAFRVIAVQLDWSWLWPHHFLLSRAGELCSGSALALALRDTQQGRVRILRLARWAFYISFGLFVILCVFSPGLTLMDSPWSTLGVAVLSIFFPALIAVCLEPGAVRTVFENRALRWLGTISYGVYVYHLLLYAVFEGVTARIVPHATPLTTQIVLSIVAACGTVLVSSLSFYTFERWFLSLKERYAGHSQAAAPPKPVLSKMG